MTTLKGPKTDLLKKKRCEQQNNINIRPLAYSLVSFLANVVGVLKGVINLLAPNTGWCWTFIGGGPDPRKVDAQLTSITYHHGVTPDGRNLGQYAPTMQPLVMVPFSKFLRAVYC